MADVFLSYARSDAATAQKVAARLRDAGHSVWFDEQLPAHRAYADVIDAELDAARAVVVLWSAEAAASQWVRSEGNRARETGKLVQARLDSTRLPMPFDQIQCADLGGWSGNRRHAGWQSVLASVAALVSDGPAVAGEDAPARGLPRRQILVAGGAAAVLGASRIAGWRTLDKPPAPSPQAQLLIDRGLAALQDNDALDPQGPGSTMQAIALMSDAAEAAPQSATAWGGLAMAYAVRKRVAPQAERAALDMRSRSAAAKALKLDPVEIRALGALRLIEPAYRNWLAVERGHRAALAKNPKLPILVFIMSDLLGAVGRSREAVEVAARFDPRKFLIPGADRKLLVNHWTAGDLQAADAALKNAVDHWPQHPQIWRTRVGYLMYTGRPGEALELLREGAERPADVTQAYVDAVRNTAEALGGTRPASSAIAGNLDYLQDNPAAALQVAQASAALGDAGTAFEIFDGYYFGEGKWSRVAPANGDEDRFTNTLFQPPMRGLWARRAVRPAGRADRPRGLLAPVRDRSGLSAGRLIGNVA